VPKRFNLKHFFRRVPARFKKIQDFSKKCPNSAKKADFSKEKRLGTDIAYLGSKHNK
jgi:hypothetical protein